MTIFSLPNGVLLFICRGIPGFFPVLAPRSCDKCDVISITWKIWNFSRTIFIGIIHIDKHLFHSNELRFGTNANRISPPTCVIEDIGTMRMHTKIHHATNTNYNHIIRSFICTLIQYLLNGNNGLQAHTHTHIPHLIVGKILRFRHINSILVAVCFRMQVVNL